jgi:hypothetical protein
MVHNPKSYRLVELGLPLPPQFERHCGYPGAKRCVAFYWTVNRKEPMYEDGASRGIGTNWPWQLFMSYAAVQKALFPFHLGSSDKEAAHWLLLSRENRTLWVGYRPDVQDFLRDTQSSPSRDDQMLLIDARNFLDAQRLMRDKLPKDAPGTERQTQEGCIQHTFLKDWLDRNMPDPDGA